MQQEAPPCRYPPRAEAAFAAALRGQGPLIQERPVAGGTETVVTLAHTKQTLSHIQLTSPV